MVGDIYFNFFREIRNPRVLGVIIGFIMVILGLGNAGGTPLGDAALFIVGALTLFASVAPEAFRDFINWLTDEISRSLRR